LKRAIRDVKDFPKPGIVFKDVTPVLLDPKLFAQAVRLMAEPYTDARITRVVAIESRGFLFGAPVALELGAGLVPIRKPGKLPAATQRVEYALEYGTDALEMHHDAVQAGVNYLGICAGAFLAGDGRGYYNSFDLASGVRFGFYAAENRGIRKAAVTVAGVNAPAIEHYWEDGPELTGWGAVVGKYPDGTPAVVEGTSGQGWVILAGVHPEAPETWRRGMTFATPASVANAYAGTLVQAALTRTWLPHY
jgi:adenine phosphoribosyltransferase